MANTAPEAMQEVEQLKKTISQSSLNTAYAAMTKQATDPATTEKMVQEIQDLFGRTIAMGESFERVKIELGRVDANGYKDQDGKPLERLQSTWIGFQNRFTHLMWDSRDAATDTVSVLRDFVEVLCPILKDTTVPLEEKKSALAESILGNKSTVRSQTQTFATLHRDIQAFATKCIAFVDAQNVELAAKIKTLTGEISALTKDIEACDAVIIEMSIVLGGTAIGAVVAGGVIAALWTTLGSAAPGILIGLIITAAATLIGSLAKLVSTLNTASNARDKEQAKQAQLNELNKQLKELQALKSNLSALDQEIKQTYARLDDFSNIRSMVNKDAQSIYDYIIAASNLDENILWRIKLIEAVYQALIPGLKQYASRVSDSTLPRD